MAMDKTTLGSAMMQGADAITEPPEDPSYKQKFYEAMAEAIIDHIKNNMEILERPNEGIAITVGGGAGAPASGAVTSQGTTPAISPGSGKIL